MLLTTRRLAVRLSHLSLTLLAFGLPIDVAFSIQQASLHRDAENSTVTVKTRMMHTFRIATSRLLLLKQNRRFGRRMIRVQLPPEQQAFGAAEF
ncbi:hypothetical protein Pan216_04140 [Planctomycetes bacterium Pan216]|uniref:Uncharacterized protein n=1 Tax=Kolteria novifilia TaxID=2527975 RepID=A0A518AXZ8_9BACT|nr:hypothetical protein Pan216_04140 [Planctomycetes bacterium Pan216]